MRRMCGPRSKLSRTFWPMIAGTLGIAGIPGSAGLFSKVAMLWRAYQTSGAYWLVGVVTAFITSFYMFRLWFMTFTGEYRGAEAPAHAPVEPVTTHESQAGSGAHDGLPVHGGIHESLIVMAVS